MAEKAKSKQRKPKKGLALGGSTNKPQARHLSMPSTTRFQANLAHSKQVTGVFREESPKREPTKLNKEIKDRGDRHLKTPILFQVTTPGGNIPYPHEFLTLDARESGMVTNTTLYHPCQSQAEGGIAKQSKSPTAMTNHISLHQSVRQENQPSELNLQPKYNPNSTVLDEDQESFIKYQAEMGSTFHNIMNP